MKLSENISINKYAIKIIKTKQLPYKTIYALNLIKLEILKIYIETYLKTRFIQLFKSLVDTFIIFDKKFDNSLYLYLNYQDLNNLIIKN